MYVGKANFPYKRALKIGWLLGHMSFPQKWKYEVLQKWKKVFIWYKVLIEISQEVEASCPEVGKRYLPARRLFLKVRTHNIGAVDLCGKSKLSSYESSKNRLVTRSHVISLELEI